MLIRAFVMMSLLLVSGSHASASCLNVCQDGRPTAEYAKVMNQALRLVTGQQNDSLVPAINLRFISHSAALKIAKISSNRFNCALHPSAAEWAFRNRTGIRFDSQTGEPIFTMDQLNSGLLDFVAKYTCGQ